MAHRFEARSFRHFAEMPEDADSGSEVFDVDNDS